MEGFGLWVLASFNENVGHKMHFPVKFYKVYTCTPVIGLINHNFVEILLV